MYAYAAFLSLISSASLLIKACDLDNFFRLRYHASLELAVRGGAADLRRGAELFDVKILGHLCIPVCTK
jgi:hypothetical protein